MNKKEIAFAAGLAASAVGGVQADQANHVGEWDTYFQEAMAQVDVEENAKTRKMAQEVAQTGQVTREQVEHIHSELARNKGFNYDIKGAEDYIQGDLSYIHNNLGLGIRVSHTDNVDQASLTGGIRLTPLEDSALARVIENGQIKVSLVESEVKNALADFDETGVGLEFVFNLRSAVLKQISFSHSKHDLNITDGSNRWRVTGVDTNTTVDTQSNATNTTQIETTTTNTHSAKNVTEDVDQTAVQALFSISQDLDVVLGYAKDNLGKSLSKAEVEYRINNNWSLRGGYEETRRFSGGEKQDIKTATLNYSKNGWSAFAGVRDNGFDTSPYAGVKYRYDFGKPSLSTSSKRPNENIGSSLVSPVQGSTEVHPHAIRQETQTTTTVQVKESVDNHAKGDLSNIRSTLDSCSADFNVSDKDGVEGVIVRLSNGAEKRLSQKSGSVTFDGLQESTNYTMTLYGVTKDGINDASQTREIGSAGCKTKTRAPETIENPTVVSEISGNKAIKIGATPTYSITATDADNGIASVTAKVNGTDVAVTNGGDTYSIVLPASASDAAGTATIEFIVTGTSGNGTHADPIKRTMSVQVEVVISSPMLNPIGTVNVQDNGGGLPTTIPAPTGSDIQPGATYSITTPTPGLSINSNTGEMTYDDDVFGNQSYSVTIEVENPDGGKDTDTFTLNVEDNF